jgi:hypothetical protein
VVDSDAKAEEHLSREEILARHKPIHTYILARHKPIHTYKPRRSRRKQVRGVSGLILTTWALVCGVLAGLILPMFWMGIIGALFGWLLPSDEITFFAILLTPPVVGIGWAMLREPEHELYPATKAFLWATLAAWLFFVFWVPTLLV